MNGGGSRDYNSSVLNAGFSDTVYTDEISSGNSETTSENITNGGES
jgi:hypothetical protein